MTNRREDCKSAGRDNHYSRPKYELPLDPRVEASASPPSANSSVGVEGDIHCLFAEGDRQASDGLAGMVPGQQSPGKGKERRMKLGRTSDSSVTPQNEAPFSI